MHQNRRDFVKGLGAIVLSSMAASKGLNAQGKDDSQKYTGSDFSNLIMSIESELKKRKDGDYDNGVLTVIDNLNEHGEKTAFIKKDGITATIDLSSHPIAFQESYPRTGIEYNLIFGKGELLCITQEGIEVYRNPAYGSEEGNDNKGRFEKYLTIQTIQPVQSLLNEQHDEKFAYSVASKIAGYLRSAPLKPSKNPK